MIRIWANGQQHTVNIESGFTPKYTRALKFITALNGKTQVSDRGADSDRYEVKLKVIGDNADIEALADDIRADKNYILIDCYVPIFGTGIDYTSGISVNVKNGVVVYPVRDLITSTLELDVKAIVPMSYDLTVSPTLPDLNIQHPVNRKIITKKTPFESMKIGAYDYDYGVSSMVQSGGSPIVSESVTFSVSCDSDDFAKIHRFVATTRGNSFTLDTSVCLELFLNSTSTSVKITNFSYKPDGVKNWKATFTMINNV